MASQILSWSVLDERLHSAMGILLYKTLISEYPELNPKEEDVKEGFKMVVNNEIAFLNQAFNECDVLPTITKAGAIDFVKYRANKKLMELGLSPMYDLQGFYLPVKDFFYTVVNSKMKNDFFALMRNGGGYSAMLNRSFEGCSYKGLSLAGK